MIPVIAIIGRSNVGKSTLFNRLTNTNNALVANVEAGLTRDRKYGSAYWKGNKFILIDTGGIVNISKIEKNLYKKINYQSMLAIKDADIILFMVDSRTGLLAEDKEIANILRKYKKKTIIVANKIDGLDINMSYIADFYSLGMGDIFSITASQGNGINALLEHIFLIFKNIYNKKDNNLFKKKEINKNIFIDSAIKIAIVGRPNVGKSTLINCIIGNNRVIVYDLPGTTRDSIYIPMVYDSKEYLLIDTAGVRKKIKLKNIVDKFSLIKTFKAIEDSNVVLLVIDPIQGLVDQDLSLLFFILKKGRSLVIVVNKWDTINKENCKKIKNTIIKRLYFINFIRVNFISAFYCIGLKKLFISINEAYQCATKHINTGLLNRIMYMAIKKNNPPIVHGKIVKPKYAHAGGYNPPLIVIHGTQVNNIPESYKRYLIKYFQRSLQIIGTPIRIQFNDIDNNSKKN